MSNKIRISELKQIQKEEVENNFKNGDLWNECEDKIDCIIKYGQEDFPERILDKNGINTGLKLKCGTEIVFLGMDFYNQD